MSKNAVKRYIAKNYATVSAKLPKELVAAFREKSAAEGVPQAEIIRRAIEDFLKN